MDTFREPEIALKELCEQSVSGLARAASGLARAAIERAILDGVLSPSQHVTEAMLASKLGISRGPIREACRALVETGLLVAMANRGFFVRQVTLKEAIDVYEVRASLARLAGRMLAARITKDQYRNLFDLVAQMDEANKNWDFEIFYELNLRLHDRIVEYTKNEKLQAINISLIKELHIFRRRALIVGENTLVSNEEHKAILSALEARDIDASGAQMEQHILRGKMRFLESFARELK
jgi:DNA-binding GntR family transcriptional regulator